MLNAFATRELEQLAKENAGLLKVEHVVRKARNPNSALHQFFEWDAKSAQEALHEMIARKLIRAYQVYVEVKDVEKPQKVRAFVSLSSDRKAGGGYRLLADVMTDEEKREEMIADALKDLEAFERKYRQLSALAPVLEAIATVKEVYRRRASVVEQRSAAY
jgi:DNA-binding Lrp family transcriptional regulator